MHLISNLRQSNLLSLLITVYEVILIHKIKICLKLLLATLYEVAILKTTPKQLLLKLNQNLHIENVTLFAGPKLRLEFSNHTTTAVIHSALNAS